VKKHAREEGGVGEDKRRTKRERVGSFTPLPLPLPSPLVAQFLCSFFADDELDNVQADIHKVETKIEKIEEERAAADDGMNVDEPKVPLRASGSLS